MTRTSIKDVRFAFERYVKAAQSAGFDTSDWILEEGSSTYGVAYRTVYKDGRRGTPGADMNGYMGSTMKEAERALEVAVSTLWAMAELRESK